MKDEDIENQRREFIGFMSRHLVALLVHEDVYNRDGTLYCRAVEVVSGFIISLYDRWFWVTAGHCLRGLDKKISDGEIKVLSVDFADYFGWEARHRHVIPFWYNRGDGVYLDKPSLSLDFAMIPIPDLLRADFQQNGVVAVSRENWIEQRHLTFIEYKVLGLPRDRIQQTSDSSGDVRALMQPVMFSVQACDPEDISDDYADTWFAGRIHPNAAIPNIEGMSGGPIFGFRRLTNGRLGYHVVAVQSRWLQESRVVFGCSVPLFAEQVYKAIEDANRN